MTYIVYLAKRLDGSWCWGVMMDEELKQKPIILVFSQSIHFKHLYSKSKRNKMVYRFVQQLLFFQQVNLTLIQSINCLNRSKNPSIPKFILKDIETKLQQGINFVDILQSYPFFFDQLITNLIDLGLKTGQLVKSFEIWLEYQKQIESFYQTIKQQLFYPALVFAAALGFLVFLVSGILPRYQQLFNQLNLDFPTAANFILEKFDRFHVFLVLIFISPIALNFKKLPGIKQLVQTMHWYQWTQLMYMAQQSGLNLADSMMLIRHHIHKELAYWHNNTLQEIRLGTALLDLLQPVQIMPAILREFLSIIHYQSDSSLHFFQAGFLLKKRLELYLSFIEKYLQPLLLILISLFCASLFYLLYLPLLELGKII